MSGGAVVINSGGVLNGAAAVNALRGISTLTLNGTLDLSTGNTQRNFAGALVMNSGTIIGGAEFGAGSYTLSGNNTFGGGIVSGSGNNFNVTNGTTTIAGAITYAFIGPSVAITKSGAGTLTLNGNSTYGQFE
jgi:hypothetical protein